jgi:hypothetical protein
MSEPVPPVTLDEVVAALNVRVRNGVARLDFGSTGFVYFVDAARWQQAVATADPKAFHTGRNPEMRWIAEMGATKEIFDRLDDLGAFQEHWFRGTPLGEGPYPLADAFHEGKAREAEYRSPNPNEAAQNRDRLRLEYRD